MLTLLALAFAGPTVGLPAGTNPVGWATAAQVSGVTVVSGTGDVNVTATPDAWLLEVSEGGQIVRVPPPTTPTEREALLALAASLAEPLWSGAPTPVVATNNLPEQVPTLSSPARPTPTTTTSRSSTSSGPPVPPAALPELTPLELGSPPPVTATLQPPDAASPWGPGASAEPVAASRVGVLPGIAADSPPSGPPTAVTADPPSAAPGRPAPPVASDPNEADAVLDVLVPPPRRPSAPFATVAGGAVFRPHGGVSGAVVTAAGLRLSPRAAAGLRLSYYSWSDVPVSAGPGDVEAAALLADFAWGDRLYVRGGGGAALLHFRQETEDRGVVFSPTLEAGVGAALPWGPVRLVPELTLRVDLAETTILRGGAVAASVSPLWIGVSVGARLGDR